MTERFISVGRECHVVVDVVGNCIIRKMVVLYERPLLRLGESRTEAGGYIDVGEANRRSLR